LDDFNFQRNLVPQTFRQEPTPSLTMQTPSLPNGTHTKGTSTAATANDVAAAAHAVLKPSAPMPATSTQIRGVDFSEYAKQNISVAQLTKHFSSTGFQASNLGRAIEIINNMVLHTTILL
jgi:hypothetical protein